MIKPEDIRSGSHTAVAEHPGDVYVYADLRLKQLTRISEIGSEHAALTSPDLIERKEARLRQAIWEKLYGDTREQLCALYGDVRRNLHIPEVNRKFDALIASLTFK